MAGSETTVALRANGAPHVLDEQLDSAPGRTAFFLGLREGARCGHSSNSHLLTGL